MNAFYSPLSNTITIFAGILREPFYSRKYADLSVAARMGTILGHELSHSVDNHGRQFTKDGILPEHDWWTSHSIEELELKDSLRLSTSEPIRKTFDVYKKIKSLT